MFNFKTKGYYKKCLAMQISNNKMLNNKLIDERKYNENLLKEIDEVHTIKFEEYKKEIKNLKSKNTKLTNEIKKLKGVE